MVLLVRWRRNGGKGPALIMYLYSIFPSVAYQGRGKEEGGSRVKDGDIMSGRLSVSPIVMQDMLR